MVALVKTNGMRKEKEPGQRVALWVKEFCMVRFGSATIASKPICSKLAVRMMVDWLVQAANMVMPVKNGGLIQAPPELGPL